LPRPWANPILVLLQVPTDIWWQYPPILPKAARPSLIH
jgi:hypothetical protein